VIGGPGGEVGGSRVGTMKKIVGKYGGAAGVGRLLWVGGGSGQETMDECGAAVGDDAELGGIVLVLRAQNAGDVEEIAVEAECSEKVPGVVGKAAGFGEGGRRVG